LNANDAISDAVLAQSRERQRDPILLNIVARRLHRHGCVDVPRAWSAAVILWGPTPIRRPPVVHTVTAVAGSGQVGGQLYYVMPFIAGDSLRARLQREGPLPAPRIAREIASGLGHAHHQGLVDRDVLYLVTGALASGTAWGGYQLRPGSNSVVANGGESAVSTVPGSPTLKLYSTVGQPAVLWPVFSVATGRWAPSAYCAGFWCFGPARVLAVGPGDTLSLPMKFAVGRPVPNPVQSSTRLHLALPRATRVALSIYDVSGRRVGDPVSRKLEAGERDLVWSPTGVKAGVYFLRVAAEGMDRVTRA
jgi:hypothetical protein